MEGFVEAWRMSLFPKPPKKKANKKHLGDVSASLVPGDDKGISLLIWSCLWQRGSLRFRSGHGNTKSSAKEFISRNFSFVKLHKRHKITEGPLPLGLKLNKRLWDGSQHVSCAGSLKTLVCSQHVCTSLHPSSCPIDVTFVCNLSTSLFEPNFQTKSVPFREQQGACEKDYEFILGGFLQEEYKSRKWQAVPHTDTFDYTVHIQQICLSNTFFEAIKDSTFHHLSSVELARSLLQKAPTDSKQSNQCRDPNDQTASAQSFAGGSHWDRVKTC